MDNLRFIISKNLVLLRKHNKLTQVELAEQLNYNDKTISKWETGETSPSIEVIKDIADFYKVSVDDLLKEDFKVEKTMSRKEHRYSRLTISLLGILTIFLLATALFVASMLLAPDQPSWLLFVYAVPASMIAAVVFNSLWGPRRANYIYISILVWTVIVSVYLGLFMYQGLNAWPLFIVGVPIQIIIILWSRIKTKQ